MVATRSSSGASPLSGPHCFSWYRRLRTPAQRCGRDRRALPSGNPGAP